jgi:hypothetical protein
MAMERRRQREAVRLNIVAEVSSDYPTALIYQVLILTTRVEIKKI